MAGGLPLAKQLQFVYLYTCAYYMCMCYLSISIVFIKITNANTGFFLRSNKSCKLTPDPLQPGKNQDEIFAKIFSEFPMILPGHETL